MPFLFSYDLSALPATGFSSAVLPFCGSRQLPLLSIRVRGGWQDTLIFQVIHGKQFIRRFSEYDKSAKDYLVPYQPAFRDAVKAWQNLSEEEKVFWNRRASKLEKHYSGYNLFISHYLLKSTYLPSQAPPELPAFSFSAAPSFQIV